jgi:hypothetical protein
MTMTISLLPIADCRLPIWRWLRDQLNRQSAIGNRQ